MGPAKLLSAIVLIGVVLAADAQSPAEPNCPACSKMLLPVCGVDDDEEIKTFPSSCVMRWCNCMLRANGTDRSFTELNTGYCEGDPSDETNIPQCFPRVETTDESEDDGPTTGTLNVMEIAPAAGTGHQPQILKVVPAAGVGPTLNVTTASPAVGVGPTSQTLNVTKPAPAGGVGPTSQTLNVTKAAPPAGVGPTPRTVNVTEATPAAGACLTPGAALAVTAVVAALLAGGDL